MPIYSLILINYWKKVKTPLKRERMLTLITNREYLITAKKLWRCNVCNDLHYGERAPLFCPTCGAKRPFVQIDHNESLKVINDRGGENLTIEEVVKIWKTFGDPNEEFKLVEDTEMVNGLAQGVIENQKNHGLKYCPCRIISGDPTEDLKLICPCNFQIQTRYKEQGECWCGLFVRRNKK